MVRVRQGGSNVGWRALLVATQPNRKTSPNVAANYAQFLGDMSHTINKLPAHHKLSSVPAPGAVSRRFNSGQRCPLMYSLFTHQKCTQPV